MGWNTCLNIHHDHGIFGDVLFNIMGAVYTDIMIVLQVTQVSRDLLDHKDTQGQEDLQGQKDQLDQRDLLDHKDI